MCHHPSISALVLSNRSAGWVMHGAAPCKSKFFGNSVQSVFTSYIHITFLDYDETFTVNFPDICARGLLVGTLFTEYIGTINITSNKSDLSFVQFFLLIIC